MVAHAWRLGIWPRRQRAAIDCVVRYASAACSVRLGLARTRRHRKMAARHDAAGESLEGMATAPRWEQGEEQVWALRAALGVAGPASNARPTAGDTALQGARGWRRHTAYHAHTPMPPAPNMGPELLARPN